MLNRMTTLALLVVVLAVALTAAGCGSSEKAPRSDVSGVDRPHSSRGERVRESASLLDPFVKDVAKTVRTRPGLVAVFPLISPRPLGEGMHVNGLGERLAVQVAEKLTEIGIPAVGDDELRNDILASNRGLDSLRTLEDVHWIARRIGAEYVVYGTAKKRVFDRSRRDERLELSMTCMRAPSRTTVAQFREEFTGGALARELYRDFTQPSGWKIGADAPTYTASVDAEVRFAARSLVHRIIRTSAEALKDRRVAIDPVSIRSVSGPRAGNMDAFTESFLAALDKAERAAAAKDSTNPALAALDHGPVTLHGKEYNTLGDALDVIRQRRAALRTSRAGQLALDLSRLLSEEFKNAGDGTFEVMADEVARMGVLALIRRETEIARNESAIDPDSIAELRAKGAQLLVQSTLRPALRSYQLRLIVVDTDTGKLIANESEDFEPRFKKDLDKLTTE